MLVIMKGNGPSVLYYDALPRCYFINVLANLAFSQVLEKAMFLSFDRQEGNERKRWLTAESCAVVSTPTAAAAKEEEEEEEEEGGEEEEILSLNRGKNQRNGRRKAKTQREKRKIINGSFCENHKFLTRAVRPIKYPRFS
ncbi:hypothetical protein K0M31_012381 [Melipona bicolor]|uniref:Uncharacterized protein n=1 Tax=Melipona bicolor TaxID=60889 RepID=A0AA40FJR0_9HYME|nr:hypothetical protein K0M31_012381 [Melipona bicolor]